LAKEAVIVATGETHAMLYPCNCPFDPEGGLSRRAELVRALRKKSAGVLLLDSGAFFAGGQLDAYSASAELDKERSRMNLKAMGLMGYDAAAIGEEEFFFGRDFLLAEAAAAKIPLLACNIKGGGFTPLIVKKVAGINFAVIGLAPDLPAEKSGGLKFIPAQEALQEAVKAAKAKGAQVVVLLSRRGEAADQQLARQVAGIDVIICGRDYKQEERLSKSAATILLRPYWQGRRLASLSFSFQKGRARDYKAQYLRLDDKVKDDAQVKAMLPQCFSDANCRRAGYSGKCVSPGTGRSLCLYEKLPEMNLAVILPKDCLYCEATSVVNYLSGLFPGITVKYLYYPDKGEADKLIKEYSLQTLPAYLLGKNIASSKQFGQVADKLIAKGDGYLVRPEAGGIAYFLGRQQIKGRLDLFFSLYAPSAAGILEGARGFNPQLHFLAGQTENGFAARAGLPEVEDCLRAACVKKYYPDKFWEYMLCRAKNIPSSWWDDCAAGIDCQKIKACAQGEEGGKLLRENTGLNKEIGAAAATAYLVDNQHIFSVKGVPSRAELKKALKR
jgi:hypothetical protein